MDSADDPNLFNVPTVIEAADTGPFFHGNSINTVEAMVAFYSSQRHLRDKDGTPPSTRPSTWSYRAPERRASRQCGGVPAGPQRGRKRPIRHRIDGKGH